jgi:biotin transporter BioY
VAGDGGRPRLRSTVRKSLPTLLTVAIAAGVSSVAITLGTLALVVPGLILWAMWAVVAQAAALEGGSWIDALRRSATLTRDHRWHALGLVFLAALIVGLPWLPLWRILHDSSTTPATFLAGTALQVLTRSFEALVAALLYFDLTARSREGTKERMTPDEGAAVSDLQSGTGDPLAPDGYTDQSRPRGWYVDPSQPHRMRYWAAGYKPVWSQRTAKTPKQTLEEWRQLRGSEATDGADEGPG